MPIHTAEERRAAQSRMDAELAIVRTRQLTDDEQHAFDALAADIAAYDQRHGSAPPAPTARTPLIPNLGASTREPLPVPAAPKAESKPGLTAGQASMQRELQRQGLAPKPQGRTDALAGTNIDADWAGRELQRVSGLRTMTMGRPG
jgi:hypothetical protein